MKYNGITETQRKESWKKIRNVKKKLNDFKQVFFSSQTYQFSSILWKHFCRDPGPACTCMPKGQ